MNTGYAALTPTWVELLLSVPNVIFDKGKEIIAMR